MITRLKNYVQTFRHELRIYRAVMADPRCPRIARWLLAAAVAYAVSPIDLIPDFIPVIGHLDDVLILPLLVWLAIWFIPNELVQEHRSRYSSNRNIPLIDGIEHNNNQG